MAWTFSVAGNKGGPGKTSETIGLAYALGSRGYKVAIIDMDSQGNATRRLAIDKAALIGADRPGIAEVLDPRRPAHIADAAVVCGWDDAAAENITVVPCLDRLTMSERSEEAAKPGASSRLKRALANDGWADEFHVVLIDTGPDVNHLLQNAFIASDRVVLVLTANHDSIEGAVYLADYIDDNRGPFETPDLAVCGVVVNNFDKDSARQRAHVANLAATFDRWGGAPLIVNPYIPARLTLANSHDDAVPITAIRHAVINDLAEAYQQHADHLVAIMEGKPA